MNLQDLKIKDPEDLLKQADDLGIENPSSLRKQDLMFAILKKIAIDGETITGIGVIEIMKMVFVYIHIYMAKYIISAISDCVFCKELGGVLDNLRPFSIFHISSGFNKFLCFSINSFFSYAKRFALST